MKKYLVITFVAAILINLIFSFGLNIPLWRVADALKVSTGLGAKLACSGRYISGFDEAQVVEDLAAYSAATRMNNLVYDDVEKRVTADFWGMASVSAQFVEGVGCYLEFGDSLAVKKVQVARTMATDSEWPAGERVSRIDPDLQEFVQDMLSQDNQQGLDTRALLLVSQGNIVAQAYKPGINAHTPLLGWSMGKSLTAILLGHLEMQGKVQIQEKALFAAWMQDGRAQIRLEDLLHMSSGLDFVEPYIPGSDSTNMLFTQHSASKYAMQSELKHLPGKHFAYSSGTSNLLARILFERLGGNAQAAYDYLYNDFFQPLGMHNAWFEPDASGVFVGSSYPYLSARDWARLAQLMLNGGELNGQRLLTQDWVHRATQPNQAENDARYGYQFWLNSGGKPKRWPCLPDDMYVMHGNRYQFVAMLPSQALAIVRLGWSSSRYPENQRLHAILEKVSSGAVSPDCP